MIDYLSQKNKDTESRIIRKKILPEFFKGIKSGEKTFEIRKDEDDIHVGDILVLEEWNGKNFTGNKEARVVTSVLRDAQEYGLMDGYCILSLQTLKEWITYSAQGECS